MFVATSVDMGDTAKERDNYKTIKGHFFQCSLQDVVKWLDCMRVNCFPIAGSLCNPSKGLLKEMKNRGGLPHLSSVVDAWWMISNLLGFQDRTGLYHAAFPHNT